MSVPGLIVAAPASGQGKTLLTLGLLRHFRDAGRRVAAVKVGPDYIDPTFLAVASGGTCLNLDDWAMRPETIEALASTASAGGDLIIAEGVMGLFDGAAGGGGATADIAARLGWPVVLVVDVRGQAASAAAVVQGFAHFRADVRVAGVIFNRVGGAGHERSIRNACAELDVAVLGFVPRDGDLTLPSRHLGLVPAREHAALDTLIARAAHLVARHVDTAALAALARPARVQGAPVEVTIPPLGRRIAIAADDAFVFTYPHVVEGWRRAGAELEFFSPLADETPSAAADAVFLPGGYPELHAGRLAAATGFLDSLKRAARAGLTIYGECGGYMVLGEALNDAEGRPHEMAGLLPVETSFAEPRLHLGYREVALQSDGPLGNAGQHFRGHEFHYCRILREDGGAALFDAADSTGAVLGPSGSRVGTVFGSFIHLVDRV